MVVLIIENGLTNERNGNVRSGEIVEYVTVSLEYSLSEFGLHAIKIVCVCVIRMLITVSTICVVLKLVC